MVDNATQSITQGITHTICVSDVQIHLTINTRENGLVTGMHAKCTPQDWQGWVNVLLETANVAIRANVPLNTILNHWLYHRFEPAGIVGQGYSIPDAIAKRLISEKYTEERNT